MSSEPKPALPHSRFAGTGRRVAALAEQAAIFEAQRWFARERSWINEKHLQLCRVAAPTFFEQARAEWFRVQLNDLGWEARLDRAGNVVANFSRSGEPPALVVSAHLDTVFAPSRPEEVYFAPDGRLIGPGVSDNGSGLVALLALARLFSERSDLSQLAGRVLIVANVGEEGEGNLNGMRYLCRQTPELSGILGFLVLDGPSIDHVTAQALASKRFEISFHGPGGHSWNDSGNPNPAHAVGDLISFFLTAAEARTAADRKARCSYNFGVLEGGTSVNAIPAMAHTKLDLRSEDPALLDEMAALLTPAVERSLERENRPLRTARLTAKIRELGSRPRRQTGGWLGPARSHPRGG